jgi:hypothetical protein
MSEDKSELLVEISRPAAPSQKRDALAQLSIPLLL